MSSRGVRPAWLFVPEVTTLSTMSLKQWHRFVVRIDINPLPRYRTTRVLH